MKRPWCRKSFRWYRTTGMATLMLFIGLWSLPGLPSDRPTIEDVRKQDWFLNNLFERGPHLCRLRIDANGWQVKSIHRQAELLQCVPDAL